MHIWAQVREDLEVAPLVEGWVGGDTPLYVERYVFRSPEKTARGIDTLVLLTQLGGARVQEGETDNWRAAALPSQSVLLPVNCPTHWRHHGPIDFAAFFFPQEGGGLSERFRFLAKGASGPLAFSDAIVAATALQITNELRKGAAADGRYMALLSTVMLEQAYRALTHSVAGGLHLRHAHFERLQVVLNHIPDHLADDLSTEVLADLAQVSRSHFRRLFQEATGEPPHRYVMAARLEHARRLLTTTTSPIARIALDCGFSSQSHLTACFRAAHAATPAALRMQAARSHS